MVRKKPGMGPRPIRVGDIFVTLANSEVGGPAGSRGIITGRPVDDSGNVSESQWDVRMHDGSKGAIHQDLISRV